MSDSGEPVRPLACAMQDSVDLDYILANCVGHDVRGTGDHQLACVGYPTGTTELREVFEKRDGPSNGRGSSGGRPRIVLGDVTADLNEMSRGRRRPHDLHSGGSRSSSVPQLSSQATTSS